MTFKEIGDVLRQEREQRGLSIEEVMHETKVSRRHVIAIEEGRVEDLPHPVYVKGFVKIYARLLDVDIKGISVAVDQAFASVIDDEHQEERRRSRIKKDIPLNVGPRKRGVSGIVLILVGALVLAGVGYGVWYYFFRADEPVRGDVSAVEVPARQDAQEPEIPAVVTPQQPAATFDEPLAPAGAGDETAPVLPDAPSPDSDAPPAGPEAPDAALDQGVGQEAQNADEPLVAAEVTVESAPDAAQQEPEESTEVVEEALRSIESEPMVIASAQAQASDAADINVLEVVGEGECWIEAKVDRDFTTDFYVRQGERVEIRFTRVLAVKFGNLGVVSLRYNGAPFPTTVPPSGVKTLTFPPTP